MICVKNSLRRRGVCVCVQRIAITSIHSRCCSLSFRCMLFTASGDSLSFEQLCKSVRGWSDGSLWLGNLSRFATFPFFKKVRATRFPRPNGCVATSSLRRHLAVSTLRRPWDSDRWVLPPIVATIPLRPSGIQSLSAQLAHPPRRRTRPRRAFRGSSRCRACAPPR